MSEKPMEPHQERVVAEKKELDGKIVKLRIFAATKTFDALPEAERDRLTRQHERMTQYSAVLGERIAAF